LTQTTNYAQVLAKIGAERSKLLSETKIKTLTESKNLQEFTTQLRDTLYREQIAKIPTPFTSHNIESLPRKPNCNYSKDNQKFS